MKETLKQRIERYKAEGYTSAQFEAEEHLKTRRMINMYRLFIGKVIDEIGGERTTELLTRARKEIGL